MLTISTSGKISCCRVGFILFISKRKSETAFDVSTKYRTRGDRKSLLVKLEMAEIIAAIEKERLGKQFGWNV